MVPDRPDVFVQTLGFYPSVWETFPREQVFGSSTPPPPGSGQTEDLGGKPLPAGRGRPGVP